MISGQSESAAETRGSAAGLASERPLRVLLVSPGSGTRGGGEMYIAKLGGSLAALGHTLISWIPALPEMDELADMLAPHGQVVRSAYRTTYRRRSRNIGAALDWRTIRQVADEWRSLKPDLIHLTKQNTEDALDLVRAMKLSGLPSITTIHVTRSQRELGAVAGPLRDFVSRAVLARTPSHFLMTAKIGEQCLRKFVRVPTPIHLIYNGVAELSEAERLVGRERARSDWGFGTGDVVLGCMGRLEAQKNPLFLLELVARLRARGLPARAAWVGEGSLEKAFRDKAAELGITDSVRYDGWRSDGQRRMCGFDVFVLPSLFEGFAHVLPEAMFCALPCLASDVDGNVEAIDDGLTGWACPVNQVDGWMEHATELVTSSQQRERMGAAGLASAQARFSFSHMGRATDQAYREVLRDAGRS